MAAAITTGIIQYPRRVMLPQDGARRPDGELLEDFVSRRDEAALAILVRRHGPMVWGVCRRVLSNGHDAEDAFQATFLVLVRRAASIASPELLANWLYGVAHQTALKARATVAKRKARERPVAEMPERAMVEPNFWNDLQPLLNQEVSRLPDIYRVVIVLCDLEGKTRREVARHLGLPEGTVESRLAKARALLAKRLRARGFTLSVGVLSAVSEQHVASAAVPALVVSHTIKVASLLVARPARAAGLISARVAALGEGVMKAMFLNKLKTACMLLFVAGLLCAGGGVVVWQTQAKAQQPMPRAGRIAFAPAQAAEQLTRTLRELDKQLWDAAHTGDWKVYDRLLAKDFIGRSTLSGRSDKTATVDSVKNRRFSDWTIRDVETKEISKDVAILTYVYHCKVTSTVDGTVRTYQRRQASFVWAQRDGAWVLVFCQETSAEPADLPARAHREEQGGSFEMREWSGAKIRERCADVKSALHKPNARPGSE